MTSLVYKAVYECDACGSTALSPVPANAHARPMRPPGWMVGVTVAVGDPSAPGYCQDVCNACMSRPFGDVIADMARRWDAIR